jgi:ComF family protein
MPVNHSCCRGCAIPLPSSMTFYPRQLCGGCLLTPPPFHHVVAPWLYGEYLSHIIHQWKFSGERRMTPLLASLWQQRAEIHSPIDLLVPVPLHWRRRWQRGFNQSELLCRQLLATSPELDRCKLAHQLVKRRRSTAAQSSMTAQQRAHNLKGAFTVSECCDNQRIAIVDDVFTTGATASAVADALATAGADHIEVWCLARTPAPDY